MPAFAGMTIWGKNSRAATEGVNQRSLSQPQLHPKPGPPRPAFKSDRPVHGLHQRAGDREAKATRLALLQLREAAKQQVLLALWNSLAGVRNRNAADWALSRSDHLCLDDNL